MVFGQIGHGKSTVLKALGADISEIPSAESIVKTFVPEISKNPKISAKKVMLLDTPSGENHTNQLEYWIKRYN